ncbi:MAG: hypothetical protein NVS4B3_24780 [Gemmatimonadaceae bacterium]
MDPHARTTHLSHLLALAAFRTGVIALWLGGSSAGAQPAAARSRSDLGGRTLMRITSPSVSEAWVSGIMSAPLTRPDDVHGIGRPDRSAKHDIDGFAERQDIAVTGPLIELLGLVQTTVATGKPVSGQLIRTDYDFKPQMELDFVNAVVTSVEIPALDIATTTMAEGKIWLRPETTRHHRAGNIGALGTTTRGLQKKWMPANFRLRIDGLDEACKHVNKIDALTINPKGVEAPLGLQRSIAGKPPTPDGSPFTFTLPQTYAQSFYQWIQAAATGSPDSRQRRTAEVQLLSSDGQTVLLTLKGTGARVSAVTAAPLKAGSEEIHHVKVALTVDKWDIVSVTPTGSQ